MQVHENIFPQLRFVEGPPLATPPAGEGVLYFKADGKLYLKDDAGVETDLTATGGTFTGGSLTSALNEARGAAIASAATTDIGAATGNLVHVTGTTTITALGTAQAGTPRTVVFDAALTLTHHATSLILPTGASITTAANDVAVFRSEGSGDWRCVGYMRADGTALAGSASAVSSVNGATGAVVLGGESIAEPVTVLTPVAGVVTINCALGDYFTLAPTANVTSILFTNLPAAGKAQTIMVRFTQHTTPVTVAMPASFKWAGGTAGVVSTGSVKVDLLAISTFNQGTTWMATLAKAFA